MTFNLSTRLLFDIFFVLFCFVYQEALSMLLVFELVTLIHFSFGGQLRHRLSQWMGHQSYFPKIKIWSRPTGSISEQVLTSSSLDFGNEKKQKQRLRVAFGNFERRSSIVV